MHPRLLQVILKAKTYALGVIYSLIVSARSGIIYRNISYHTDASSHLDIYIHPSNNDTMPKQSIIIIHGGGWIAGDKRERALFCAALAKEGYVVFNINYRLAPQFPFPNAVHDSQQAIQWIVAHAHEYGGAPNRLTIIGDSAGAHIASLAAVSKITQKYIKKLILYYGIYDTRTVQYVKRPFIRTYLRALLKDHATLLHSVASPIAFVQNLPSTLLIASEKDPLHIQTLELSQAMKKANKVHTTLLLNKQQYPRARHGFQNLPLSKAGKESFRAVLDFLKD
jgi:acetyl esterase/lipase